MHAILLRGDFEELSDVTLFVKTGEDSHGLALYIRLRGTVRTENVHQKMKTAIGPWGIGAKTAHMLLVLLCYRYNVKSQIRRCGAYDFGHCELYLIDRIQRRVQEIFNILVWPRHKNLLCFKGKKDFISVSIGPLCYDENYVLHLSPEPAGNLKGDAYFIAKQMGLKYPLLHIGSPTEIRIFTNFIQEHPGANTADFEEMARLFKSLSNGKDIFPKLPSMLKSYFGTWEKNLNIRLTEKSLASDVHRLLGDLFSTKISDDLALLPPTAEGIANDDDDDAGDTMEFLPEENVPEVPLEATRLNVPPAQAPTQQEYTPAHCNTDPDISNARHCAWHPRCQKMSGECGGRTRPECQYLGDRAADRDFVEEMMKEKRAENNRKRAEKAREKRRREK